MTTCPPHRLGLSAAPEPAGDLADRGPATPAALAVLGTGLRIDHIEGRAFGAHGLDVSGWPGKELPGVLTADTRRELLPYVHRALAGEPQSFRYVPGDGSRSYAVQLAPIRDAAGTVGSVVATAQDITERLALEAEAVRSRDRLRNSERMVGVGSWEMDLRTDEVTFSAGFARLLGIAEDAPLRRETYRAMVHPDDRPTLAAADHDCRTTGSSACEHRIVRPGGEVRLLSLRAETTIGADGAPLMRGALLDITEQRAQEGQRMRAEQQFRGAFDSAPIGMALSDPHTGCYLRVNDALCRMLARSREELLQTRIASISHPADHEAVETAIAEIVAGRRSESRHEKRYRRPDGSTVWGLLHLSALRDADGSVDAMYSQVVDVTERKAREERLEEEVSDALWLGRIRDALDHDRFELFAQPIVDLTTGETVQNELLLRMREDDGTVIAPGAFLPVAERYGLISEIDRWVLRRATEVAATGTPAEFNLSGRSVGDPSILVELERAIGEAGVDPSLLVVEITETALMAAREAGRAFACGVRELGCRLALDDFGTGFSSLAYLKHLPADHLKIDIEFVRELSCSETDARVVRGIVGLAREFDQVTIAEGVEDEATLLRLRELGVDLAQGYLFGAPAPFLDASRAGASSARGEAGAGTASAAVAESPDEDRDDAATEVVRAAFDAFAARDPERMLAHCSDDVVLRMTVTSRRAGRRHPYRGGAGIREYLADVREVWDALALTPRVYRRTPDGVFVFGEVDGLRRGTRVRADVIWVARVRGGRLTSIESFESDRTTPTG